MKVLMVCLGNICRSPLAEGILQAKADAAGLGWVVDSASTNTYHTGDAPHYLSQKVALEHGINISQQKSRRFTIHDIEHFDVIYAMADDVIEDMKRIAGKHWQSQKIKCILEEIGSPAAVPDPYYGGIEGFYKVYDMLDNVCNTIIKKYAIDIKQ
jgi:protein-tyrosine phosphatase